MASFYEELHKSDSISDEQENVQSRANADKWIFRLLLVILGFMPLIVMANVEEFISPLISNVDVLSSGVKGDLFTHYKAVFIIVITIIILLIFLSKLFFMNGKIKKTSLNYALGGFVLAILVSTIMSPNISVALNGQYNRSEGAILWICYIVLFFVAMNITYPKNVVNYIMYTMIPFVFINLFIMVKNFYGNDLLQLDVMQKLVSIMLPEGANISEGSQLLGTLNQWNYMSGMFAMMTVMYLAWAVVAKKGYESAIGVVTACASVAIMLMAVSTNGFVTFLSVIPFILWIAFKSNSIKKAVIVLVSFIVVMGGSLHILSLQNEKVWAESIGFFYSGENPYTKEELEESSPISTKDISFTLFGEKVAASDNSFELPVLPAPAWSPGTGRTYIWQETLELVAERPLFGYGIDTITYHFPHYQLEARGNLLIETIVDKPHNIYIGLLYGTGIIGLVLFMIFVLITLKETLIRIIKFNSKSNTSVVLGIIWLSFLVQALFNDTTPAMTGTLFVMIGILMGLQNRKEEIVK
ncbi:O-antigen ligase family protein [Solibacillus sp. FSL W8-0474]|uniref:O-antigen ligase family protein n=1 Tax=Solibacillus sp. FSL W8-0474 TaxID=2975336 RepID=UPI0030FCA50E